MPDAFRLGVGDAVYAHRDDAVRQTHDSASKGPLGIFREFKSGRPNDDSVHDFVCGEPPRREAITVSYLRLGDRMG